jgi:CheY-like chemotaxis protein
MPQPRDHLILLVADDDEDHLLLTQEALVEGHVRHDLRTVGDGEQLLDYLLRRDVYADPAASPQPDLILLDLNMPRKSGYEALQEIKADPALRRIPIVVLTTSRAEEDVLRAYALGASAFITKPVTFERFVDAVATVGRFWLETVQRPPNL